MPFARPWTWAQSELVNPLQVSPLEVLGSAGLVDPCGIVVDTAYIIIPALDSSEKGLLRVLIGPLPLFSSFT
jgi:hypothetical protein